MIFVPIVIVLILFYGFVIRYAFGVGPVMPTFAKRSPKSARLRPRMLAWRESQLMQDAKPEPALSEMWMSINPGAFISAEEARDTLPAPKKNIKRPTR